MPIEKVHVADLRQSLLISLGNRRMADANGYKKAPVKNEKQNDAWAQDESESYRRLRRKMKIRNIDSAVYLQERR